MLRILVDVRHDESKLAALRRMAGVEVRLVPFAEKSRELPLEVIHDVEILFCSFPPLNFSEMQAIRWVQIASSGYSQLFPHEFPERGIRATNARGCFDVPIAEWCLAMMVNLVRDLPQMMRNQDARLWDRSAQFQRELRGMTVGIWGYGGMGREIARLAKCFGMRVHVQTRHGTGPAQGVYRVPGTGDPEGTLPDSVFIAGQEQEFLTGLDFLILATPLTKVTECIIGERELSALPRGAFLLNPARGAIVQESALLRALNEHWIAGAAIDTHYRYPMPQEHPLWGFRNVLFTPHIAGSTLNQRFTERLWDIFLANVEKYRSGQPLWNELTPAMLQGG